MITRQHIEVNFFDQAEELRAVLDAKFDKPYDDTTLWQYYAVPQLYTYLRTTPRGVFPNSLFGPFLERLHNWSFEYLGLLPIGDPTLHLMVNGCSLSLHSDFHNGSLGYVYSLTRWDRRTFSGGETLLMKDGIPSYKKHQAHGPTLFELVPACFNQLLVFDDRIVHATPVIEGSMNPKEGRIAMVGHIRSTSARVTGPLSGSIVRQIIAEMLPELAHRLEKYRDVDGTISFRLKIDPGGEVTSLSVLTNNLIVPLSGYAKSDTVEAVRAIVRQMVAKLRFPSAGDVSHVTFSILLPVPDLRPIRVTIPHRLAVTEALQCVAQLFSSNSALGRGTAKFGLTGASVAEGFVVHEPIEGMIEVTSDQVLATFDAPMWVPSQRVQFEQDVVGFLKAQIEQQSKLINNG
jgi:hypothetical protein